MPTVTVKREYLFEELGKKYSDDEFRDLCFQYGIELDDITTLREISSKQGKADESLSDAVVYKIEVPANRYDLLCLEGIVNALRVFAGAPIPTFKINIPNDNDITTITVNNKNVNGIRPYVLGCILRGITFTQDIYESFIDLQDKLHLNVGRRRQLVAIGTHDFDKISNKVFYDAQRPSDIKFKPLNEDQIFATDELFKYYKNKAQCHLKPYLSITENSPLHPVIFDSNNTVLSLPPIINGDHSKITLKTKNIFIECTGTDSTKLNIALNTIIAMFSRYCSVPFSVEAVKIINQNNSFISPDLSEPRFTANVSNINRSVGINLPASEMAKLLNRMQLRSQVNEADNNSINVTAPVTRSDILHPCDIVEDVAIAFGYNNLKPTIPKCYTIGVPNRINSLSDQLRDVVAQAGFSEVLTWALVSHAENYKNLRLEDDHQCVKLGNAKSTEFEVVRTSLIPGLLKVLASNLGQTKVNVRIFELSDVCVLDNKEDVGARNIRKLSAAVCSMNNVFESIHTLLDRIMLVNRTFFEPAVREDRQRINDLKNKLKNTKQSKDESNLVSVGSEELESLRNYPEFPRLMYRLESDNLPTFLPGRCAKVVLIIQDNKGENKRETVLGHFGVCHPLVIKSFEIDYPVAVLELNIQTFLDL